MTGLSNFERFWAIFPNRKGKKSAEKAFEKACKGEDETEFTKMICLAIDAQKRYRCDAETSGEFIPNWKMPATWLNAGCWDDELRSHAELKERTSLNICSVDGCDWQVHGPRCTKCRQHLDIVENRKCVSINDLRKYAQNNGLLRLKTETAHEYSVRCRKHLAEINPAIAKRLKA